MSHLAVQAGFKPSQVEASDVILFSSVYGNAIMNKSLDEYEIKITGFDEEELKDPINVLYALIYYRQFATSTNELTKQLIKDGKIDEKRKWETLKVLLEGYEKNV